MARRYRSFGIQQACLHPQAAHIASFASQLRFDVDGGGTRVDGPGRRSNAWAAMIHHIEMHVCRTDQPNRTIKAARHEEIAG
ncbi:hypothetical protein [Sphingobium sp. TCM1]|uniref:hypothetical protein n=1 Tax=Sphingobium sp. TCM1 TaxID=453246 RepID=UPI001E621005|nr:hypothetical protein [Sphingobium sp. TCM1]